MDVVELNWEQVDKLTTLLTKKLSVLGKFEEIYMMPRGGLVVGGLLSYKLNIPKGFVYTLRDKEEYRNVLGRALVVDDICDSGTTMNNIRRECKSLDAVFVTLIVRANLDKEYYPDVYALEYPGKEWIVFPWAPEDNPNG